MRWSSPRTAPCTERALAWADSEVVGPFGFGSVFGLATAEGVLYGVGGTQIFGVDPTTGDGTLVLSYGGKALGQALGQSFITTT